MRRVHCLQVERRRGFRCADYLTTGWPTSPHRLTMPNLLVLGPERSDCPHENDTAAGDASRAVHLRPGSPSSPRRVSTRLTTAEHVGADRTSHSRYLIMAA
jgi:hypothetical protein